MDTSTQLHELRDRLVRAQRAENKAIRELSEFSTERQSSDKTRFKQLLDAVHLARERSLAAYEAWNQAVRALQNGDRSLADAEPLSPSALNPSARMDGSSPEGI